MKTVAALLLACGGLLAGSGVTYAQTVALSGMLGTKALLVVDGGAPKSVAVGESHRGVKVLGTSADLAVVEVGGSRQTLRIGEAPVSAGQSAGDSGNGKIVLHAGSGGHFLSQGQINGRAATFLVDTGASTVAMSVADAERLGLNYRSGQPVRMNTANGVASGWLIQLTSVRLGHVDVYNVDAVVSLAAMPYILLGNSYLTRFQMTRTNDQLVLDKRY